MQDKVNYGLRVSKYKIFRIVKFNSMTKTSKIKSTVPFEQKIAWKPNKKWINCNLVPPLPMRLCDGRAKWEQLEF